MLVSGANPTSSGTNHARGGAGDASLRRLKSEHLKKRGDRALQEGDCRLAWEKYSEAIDAKADKEGLHMLYSNRSLAFSKAQRHADALSDADTAIRLAPKWGKAHWRRGMALLGLCDTPGAVLAFLSAWQLAKDDSAECERKLRQVVHQLKREELGAGFLHLFGQLQEQGAMRGAEVEAANEQELVEAWFRVITAAHRGQPRPGPLYHTYLTSLKQGLDPAEAYTLRSAVCAKAKCYLQARADAQAAVTLLGNALRQDPQHPDAAKRQAERAGVELLKQRMGRAYLRLGEAFLAEPDHEDRDAVAAFKALTRGSDVCPADEETHDRLQEASEALTKEQLERAALEVYNEGMPWTGQAPLGCSSTAALRPGERSFRVELQLAFPTAKVADVGSRAREVVRQALAAAAGVDSLAVTLESVLPPRPPTRPGVTVGLHVAVGPRLLQGSQLVKVLQHPEQAVAAVGGQEAVQLLGQLDVAGSRADVVDVTPACMEDPKHQAGEDQGNVGAAEDRRLAAPSRPKLELEVPYRLYRLTTCDGRPVERTDKHPFCMSRVYYDATEKPQEVWAELADGSCRWRQTGSEIRVQALRVPPALPPRELAVTFEPHSLRVAHRTTGEVFLEGRLLRGIVPEDCYWTHCGGGGEDGCVLSLHKMNLEVLRRHWLHSEMWWSRLFDHHGEIAWDDYEKDYSDLPEEVLAKHRVSEAIKGAEREVEAAERSRREALQEADDLRKRTRQERLGELRSGVRKDWVTLHRGS